MITHIIEASADFRHQIFLISGICSDDDVMRGEETQLVGCNGNQDQLYIFPGTHSKHIEVKGGNAVRFRTYMTGEFFAAFCKNTILAVSVNKVDDLKTASNIESFKQGVRDCKYSNILHNCFLVRTNTLFNKFTNEENYYYLSGLLIGTELMDLSGSLYKRITITANKLMTKLYSAATVVLDPLQLTEVIKLDSDDMLLKGQLAIYKKVIR
ncbi:MAG: 2-dehydro-3-deoxygalactonokinase [Fimbriimonadaceae bacterium]|nr:2-dehydro-3-deoxygalactonokinase [Chitinophagales bacterium]